MIQCDGGPMVTSGGRREHQLRSDEGKLPEAAGWCGISRGGGAMRASGGEERVAAVVRYRGRERGKRMRRFGNVI